MTARALLEAVADEIASAKCDSLLPASLIAWERRIRTIASSLEGQVVVTDEDALATYENRPGHSRLTWAQAAADLRQSLTHSRAQDSGGEAVEMKDCPLCGVSSAEAAQPWHGGNLDHYDLDALDWEPDEQHTLADMANVGRALMREIANNMPGYCWNESPAEIVCDLINERDEAAAEQPAKGDVPLCEKYGAGCNFPDCPCDVDDPLTQQPFKGECFADALDEDIQEARTPQQSDPADAVCDCGSNVDNRQPHHDECAIYATPPTAQRHDECEMTEALRACLAYFEARENIGDEPNEETEIAAWLRSILAHGAGAAVEAGVMQRDWPPTVDEARRAIGESISDAIKAIRVLSTMMRKEKLSQGYAVAEQMLADLGRAEKLIAALATPQQRSEQGGVNDRITAMFRHLGFDGLEAMPGWDWGYDRETCDLEEMIANGRLLEHFDEWIGSAALSTQPLLSDQPAGVSNGARVDAAARALVAKMEAIHEDPEYQSVWVLAANRGMPYTGPKYEVELAALKAALHPEQAKDGGVS